MNYDSLTKLSFQNPVIYFIHLTQCVCVNRQPRTKCALRRRTNGPWSCFNGSTGCATSICSCSSRLSSVLSCLWSVFDRPPVTRPTVPIDLFRCSVFIGCASFQPASLSLSLPSLLLSSMCYCCVGRRSARHSVYLRSQPICCTFVLVYLFALQSSTRSVGNTGCI